MSQTNDILIHITHTLTVNRIIINRNIRANGAFKQTGAYRKLMQSQEILYKVERLLKELVKIESRSDNTF